ncbi:hypothetical protein PRIO_5402 [Paenibacillus riograndensis SBR5]|uniref:Uncharacterized protein n=1 Tax=Paenibacillus riograndensis SBR5 TaxID=1073571 RepID=A0A0E4HD46_9BACL|nr:hypothetical protein PRIO_5402 [Paenibacillus riograndensis SBR5]
MWEKGSLIELNSAYGVSDVGKRITNSAESGRMG